MVRLCNVFYLAKVLFGFFLLFFTISPVRAFFEEFNSTYSDVSYWEPSSNSGLILFSGEKIKLQRANNPTSSFPYLKITKDVFPTTGEFTIDISFNYLTTGNFGDGIVISKSTPLNGVLGFSNHDVFFKIWQDTPAKLRVVSHVCSETNPNCNQLQPHLFFHTSSIDLDNHVLKIIYLKDGVYKVFVDNLTSPLFVSVPNQERPSKIWLGNPVHTNTSDYWSSFEVDYVRVTSGVSGDGGIIKTPVVILPGMGASWDMEAILNGTNGNNWAIPDFINVYDNLIASFENVGYVINTNLFIFAYDWRRELDTLSDQLNLYVEDLVSSGKIGTSQKIDFVGHSMGGMVARSYLQKHGSGKTNKLVTVGSPHLGAVDAYSIWEGATVMDRPWWQKVAIELLTRLNRQPGENKVITVRRLTPAIKDMLPIYNFLILNGVLKPWDNLTQKNNYLSSIDDTSTIDGIVKVIVGTGVNTKYKINATDRNFRDVMAGKWEDGKILSFILADGDGTIWLGSAKGVFNNQQIIATDHAGLISSKTAIINMFSELGLDTSKVVIDTNPDTRSSVLAVVLRSPGTLEVCEELVCNSSLGWYFPTHKLFLLPGFTGQQINVKVLENGLGNYNLHIGKLSATSEEWKRIEGKLESTSQQDNYQITSSGNLFKVAQSEIVAQHGLVATAGLLESIESGWDEGDDVNKVIDETLSLLDRLKAARKVRYSLVKVIKKSHFMGVNDAVEKSLRVWVSLDRFMKNLLTNSNYANTNQVSRHLQTILHRRQGTEKELASSSSLYSGEFLGRANEQSDLVSALGVGQETLRLDKLHSTRYLYLLSLELKN